MRKVQWGRPDRLARLEIREQLVRQAEMERRARKEPPEQRAPVVLQVLPGQPGRLALLAPQDLSAPLVWRVPPAHAVIQAQQEQRARLARRD